MTRFYFDILNDKKTIDPEGQLFPDLAAAREAALACARDMAAEDVRAGHVFLRHGIAVRDEKDGEPVFTISFADAFTISF